MASNLRRSRSAVSKGSRGANLAPASAENRIGVINVHLPILE
jgi:hypothetical protein